MNNRELACKIANYLFTNRAGEHAQRLVLELPNLKDGGGWCEAAVADAIEDHLNAATKPSAGAGSDFQYMLSQQIREK